MKNICKNREKGITLIALVITIVILLILAGIAISALTQTGLFEKAKQADKVQQETEMKEELILAIHDLQIEKEGNATINDITQEWLISQLKGYNQITVTDTQKNNKKVKLQKNKITKEFFVDTNLNVIDGQEDNNVSKFKYIQDNLLLYYDAKSNVGDSHNTETQEWKNLANDSNNGILNGNPTWNDDSLYFDGADDYIDCGKIGLEDSHSFTYECVFSYKDSQKSTVLMNLYGGTGGGSVLGFSDNSLDYLKFHLDNGNSQKIESNITVGDNTIHQIIATYNSEESKLYLYIDGKLNNSEVVENNLTYPDLNFNIGRWVGGQSQYYKGNIYNVLVYNKYLSNEEILNNYKVDNQKYLLNVEQKDDGQLLLYYDAKNNLGDSHSTETQEWKNLATDSNNGILNGNPTWNNESLYFDGTDDYIDCGQINLENNHSFTYECTISYTDSQKSKTIVGAYGLRDGSSLGIDDNSSDYLKFHLNNYSLQRINSTKTLNDGKVHNIIATYKNDKLILYIDGKLDGSLYVPKGLTYSNLNVNIGRWIVGQQYYKGNIYSVKVYNKYLTKDEIIKDFQYEKNRYNVQ